MTRSPCPHRALRAGGGGGAAGQDSENLAGKVDIVIVNLLPPPCDQSLRVLGAAILLELKASGVPVLTEHFELEEEVEQLVRVARTWPGKWTL